MKRTSVFKLGAALYLAGTLMEMATAAPPRPMRAERRAPSLLASFRHRHPVHAVAVAGGLLAAGGGLLAAGGDRDGVLLWETKSWRLRHRLPARNSRLTALALSPDGQRLAAGSREGAVRLWGLTGGGPIRR
ncbi:MAG TPA: hypothetical protein VK689_15025 [Armatimonadota bacterium]|nr:hypothetical protein [Armatimonadota bacterium]